MWSSPGMTTTAARAAWVAGNVHRNAQDLFQPMRLGASFYLGVAIPAMLDHAPPHPQEGASLSTAGR